MKKYLSILLVICMVFTSITPAFATADIPVTEPMLIDTEIPAADEILVDESTEELVDESTEEPVDESTEELVDEPTEEPVDEPTEEPVEEPTEEPVEEPTEEPVEEFAEEPVEEPTEEPVEEPADEPVEEPTEEPVEEPTEEPVEEPTEEPVEEPTEEPVEEPTEEPVEESTEEPVDEPTDEEEIVEEVAEEELVEEQEEEIEEIETEISEDETYMLNIVLFALKNTKYLERIEDELDELGISHITPLFTDEDGNAVPFGKKGEVWYRAYTPEDVYETVDELMEIKGVTYSEPEYIYTSDYHGMPKEFNGSRDWAHHKHLHRHKDGVDEFWWETEYEHDYAPGYGTVVAVIDTGVDYTHEDLAANMWVNTAELEGAAGVDDDGNGYIDDIYGANTTATGKKAGDPMDDNGHGTHVAGIIGMSANGEGGIGLAYGAKIMAIKAGQSAGTLASSHIAKAINYAHMMGADVINMSFGGSSQSYLVETALEDAFGDCVLVASAGNDGLPTTDADPAFYPKRIDVYPAGYSYVIGVMATDRDGDLTSFSNWDYAPDANAEYELTAPGKDIYSTLPGNRYAKWNGTSMAAPFVSAAAAIVRSHYDNKDTYSSRFIMGQLTSATTETTSHSSKDGNSYAYPAMNVYDSIYYLPKPNISVKETFMMDSVKEGTPNDGDAIIDAGETIDLGVLVRNQWGKTGEITVKADAISDMGVVNPYIEFINDTVTLDSAGTFAEVDNGFEWEDGMLVGIDDPIQFKVAEDIPNDSQIKINITVTTTNGIDEDDNTTYTAESEYIFRVQAGQGLKGTLSEDMTLTKDHLWVIENTLYIPEGITLTIEPGTKVQFYSSDYEDAYGGLTVAAIHCDGTLNAIGTEEEPIEMFPGAGFENYVVEIAGKGIETLKYCNIVNPKLGVSGLEWVYPYAAIYLVDHCVLTQNRKSVGYRYLENGNVKTANNSHMYIATTTNSIFKGIISAEKYALSLIPGRMDNCLFEECAIEIENVSENYQEPKTNSVYLSGNTNVNSYFNDWEYAFKENDLTRYKIYTNEELGKTYVKIKAAAGYTRYYYESLYQCYQAVAESLGGTLACANSAEEDVYLTDISANYGNYSYVGLKYNYGNNKHEWIDGSEYEVKVKGSNNDSYVILKGSTYGYNRTNFTDSNNYMIIEVPITKTQEEIDDAIKNFDYEAFVKEYGNPFTNNAVLNPILNTDTETWFVFTANTYNSANAPNYLYNNYWGTENETLINKMITDADDFAGTYQDIIHDPILTLESESLSEIYPFVTQVYLTDEDGNKVTNVQPGETYSVHVHFNRDMDTDEQPSVSYGPAVPYTDFMVDGDFVSDREWVGTTKISNKLTSGTMFFRTKGGCAADDNWLVCGEDVLRFSFDVSTTGVLAMILNAEGGANRVDLSWAQNDYEVLGGYNLYRSTSETTGFKKINTTILAETEYVDTDVEPGVTYYYYFKVVNTDGDEEAMVSNTVSATPIDNIAPVLTHSPITNVKAGSQITISAKITDNIAVAEAKLYYRTGEGEFKEKELVESATAGLYVTTIPANAVTKAGVSYYIEAKDADGNVAYSGTAELPNVIVVNSDAYISGITPASVAVGGGKTVTILGGNFTEDMVLKLGGEEIEFTFVDSGQINFTAPAKASGTYAVTLTTTEGVVVASSTPLSYTDASSMAQIPTSMTMVSGVPYQIPLYISASGDVISLHAELDLPSSYFTKITVEKADADANFTVESTYSGGVLKIGCIGTSNINTSDAPLLNIIVTPKVTEDVQCEIALHDVAFNGVEVSELIGGGDVHLKPSFTISALVNYFADASTLIDGVTISAAGVKAVTDENGAASLTVDEKTVSITASRTEPKYAITAYDASLVLQSAVGMVTLDDNQKLAADVSGDGAVNEYDAALILQKAVKKIDAFPIGKAWIFVPDVIEKTLTATGSNLATFTAISVGDVDGSYAGDVE